MNYVFPQWFNSNPLSPNFLSIKNIWITCMPSLNQKVFVFLKMFISSWAAVGYLEQLGTLLWDTSCVSSVPFCLVWFFPFHYPLSTFLPLHLVLLIPPCSFSCHCFFPSMLFMGLHYSLFLSFSPFPFYYIVPSLMLFHSLVLSSHFLFLSILQIFQLSLVLPFPCPMLIGYFALSSPVSALPTTFPCLTV